LLEEGTVLRQLLERYVANNEVVSVRDAQEAIEALNHSPAQALIANAPTSRSFPVPMDGLSSLPYGTPLISCWVPGKDEVARKLGVVEYLVKPIAAQDLLSAIEGLGDGIERLLLVDDEPEIQQLFSRVLSSTGHGYQVTRAMNGQRALELLRERQPDLMLLDLVMPQMDGFQVLREKAEDPAIRSIPVIVISSRDPARGPVVSDALTVTQGGGLSISDLAACIQAVSEVLAPSAPPGRSGQQAVPAE
jgi:CheY-like chemotaxis protein